MVGLYDLEIGRLAVFFGGITISVNEQRRLCALSSGWCHGPLGSENAESNDNSYRMSDRCNDSVDPARLDSRVVPRFESLREGRQVGVGD